MGVVADVTGKKLRVGLVGDFITSAQGDKS